MGGRDIGFDAHRAFSRNIGWITEAEARALAGKRVAIAGMGGVGGHHLLTLARLGIGAFRIADFDVFEIENFNRQVGATLATVGREKAVVMREMAMDINPSLDVEVYEDGVDERNVNAFLDGADLYVDGLDAFALDTRAMVFARCHALGIPAVTVAPIGMGAALLTFLPGRMSFEDYFGLQGRDELEQAARFALGLSPAGLHRRYLRDPSTFALDQKKAPSTPMGCALSAGVAGSEALKILLGRRGVRSAPHAILFDAYLNRMVHTWLPGGHRNPLQRIRIAIATRMLRRQAAAAMCGRRR